MNYIMKLSIIFIIIFFNMLHAECSDLDSTECLEWAEFCEWNDDTDICQEIGGGGESAGPVSAGGSARTAAIHRWRSGVYWV